MGKIKSKYEFDIIENLQDFEILLSTEKVNPHGLFISEFQGKDVKR